MAVDFSSAVNAYDKVLRSGAGEGMEPRRQGEGTEFGELLKTASEQVVDKLETADAASLKAVAGNASLDEVVMAVTQAEMALNTVVSIRDRVIQAYQEVLRMPI
nr:flagellar hook-basal body complex protein FliE [Desulfuromonadales bacterium]